MSQLILTSQTTPTPPASTKISVYPKSDGHLYKEDSSGNEVQIAEGTTAGINQLTGEVTAGPGTGSQIATVVSVDGSLAADIHSAELATNAATSSNTPSVIVKRDTFGNFSSGTITATLNGNAATATIAGNITATSNSTLTTLPSLTLPGSQVSGNISGNSANVTGTIAIVHGGTGQITQQTALNALAGTVTSAQYLRGNGTNVVMSGIQASDVPTLNQATTASAGSVSGTNVVTNTNLSQMPSNTLKGNNTGSTANATDLTVSQVKTMLNLSGSNSGDVTLAPVATASNANAATLIGQVLTLEQFNQTFPGVVPASGKGTNNFLRADGTWATADTFTTSTLSYTATHTSTHDVQVSLGTWMNWSPNFVQIYQLPHFVQIPFADCQGVNTLDSTRQRMADGVVDSDPSYLVNLISFLPGSGVTAGNTIRVVYTEGQNFEYRTNLVPAGWDFTNNTYYGGTGTDWQTNPNPQEIYSIAIPVEQQGGNAVLQSIDEVQIQIDTPSYLPTTYLINGTTNQEIRFLIPNVLIDQSNPLNFDYSIQNFRIEAFQFPRNRRHNSTERSTPFGKFNYMAYWTTNLMRTTSCIFSIGRRSNYAEIHFRIRNMVTNSVSDWLPIHIEIKKGFRPRNTVSVGDKTKAVYVRYKF